MLNTEWEKLPQIRPEKADLEVETYRLKIEGGWLYVTIATLHLQDPTIQQTFVRDSAFL